MDHGGVLIVNLAKGRIGEDPANLLGGLLVTLIGLAAYTRADTPEQKRRPVFCYVDEFHNFTTLSFANMLAELRKYKVGLILANQYLDQLDREIRNAVLGNVGTTICFRLGPQDAKFMAHEFGPKITPEDFMNLPNYHCYIKMMIDGAPSRPFSAETMAT